MLAKKTKGIFIEVSDFSILAAVTTSLNAPYHIESLQECRVDVELEELQEFIHSLAEVKARGFLTGHCSIYTQDYPGIAGQSQRFRILDRFADQTVSN